MIFVGDIALPHKGGITLEGIPKELLTKQWIGNLEGSLVQEGTTSKEGLYNSAEAIDEIVTSMPFVGFTLANNHILDLGNSRLMETLLGLKKKGINCCGAGENIEEASQPLLLTDNGKALIILNFGWSVIQCELAGSEKAGVNPLTKDHVRASVQRALTDYPDAAILPIMHWNYELEAEPQPFERQLAKELIDMGVAGVIGGHAHRVGGIEIYKKKPIVYSLGNWLFKQGVFKEGENRFPAFCNLELAFEWDLPSGDMKFHFFKFDPDASTLNYSHTISDQEEELKKLTPFWGLSDQEYKGWYKNNHYHKRKGLPIYYWDDSAMMTTVKNRLNLMRDHLVAVVQKVKG